MSLPALDFWSERTEQNKIYRWENFWDGIFNCQLQGYKIHYGMSVGKKKMS